MSENDKTVDTTAEEPVELVLGDEVLYKLSTDDAEAINRRREDARGRALRFRSPDGTQVHVGTDVVKGEYTSAKVTRVLKNGGFNLKVSLDGSDDYWVTERREGSTAGTFKRK